MSRHLRAQRHSMGALYPTEEPALIHVGNGRVVFSFEDGDRITFDAQDLLGEVELQLLQDKRQGETS